jgi:hypothetical protein
MMTLHAALVAYVLTAMCSWLPMRHWQTLDYQIIAEASVTAASEDPEDAIQLVAIASFESRFAVTAHGKLGEIGAFQLRPFFTKPASCAPWSEHPMTTCTPTEQARMALYRWKTMGRCSYTGEAPASECPFADHRYLRAFDYSYAHPFVPPSQEVVAAR